MKEFQELVKDAPKFASMERGELVAYAYAMHATGTKMDAENAKLRELLADTLMQPRDYCQKYGIEYDSWDNVNDHLDARMRELGIEVDG